ncbi:MAG: xthA2 [Rickettsiaceae bacterium]|jgi:exodeoxyribonuclease-3|nr:xthA2 [Rickettsiaceae bacterium]
MSKKNITVAVWNVNSIKARLSNFIEWAERTQPDFILLQELKCEEHKFPFAELESLNYNYAISGQKSYNGVAILSKYPLEEINKNFAGDPDPSHARFIEASAQTEAGYIRLISVYVPNGGEVGSDKFEYKLKFFDEFEKYIVSKQSIDELLIVGGDYNVAPEEIDVYDPKHLQNSTCFTLTERQKMRSLLNAGFEDAYRLLHPSKAEYTWWDYRGNSFTHNKGMRIDHILLSPKAADALEKCYIDNETRGKLTASDHAPIIAEFRSQNLGDIFS